MRQKGMLSRFLRWAKSVSRLVALYCRPLDSHAAEKLITLGCEGTPSLSSSLMKLG